MCVASASGAPGLSIPGRGLSGSPLTREVPLKRIVEDRNGLPTFLANDVNAMALAENAFGAGKDFRDFVCLTLGTGVGGGIILDGKLREGITGTAGEIGHMTVDPNGPRCNCGNRGCLERLIGARYLVENAIAKLKASGNGGILIDMAGGDPRRITPRLMSEAASKGDDISIEVFREAGEALGIIFASLTNFLNPEAFVVGGGVSKAGDLILEPARRTLLERAMREPAEAVRVVPAALGGDAGMIGSSLLVRIKDRTRRAEGGES